MMLFKRRNSEEAKKTRKCINEWEIAIGTLVFIAFITQTSYLCMLLYFKLNPDEDHRHSVNP
ncbi:MAG: hypothetical protein R3321_06650 [Nitrososphaeraceae archaeon]|nr:hypothetical protein [Nitrososphaeraceae archaeon]